MLIAINHINLNGGTQTREKLDDDHISRLVEQIDSGHELPPISLTFDGSCYWLTDGFHRVSAHRLAGKLKIDSIVSQGTQRDAVLKSLSSNATHGLPRSRGDLKRAVLRMLLDDEWGQWADRRIADTCAATVGYVKRLRLETLPTIPGIIEPVEPVTPSTKPEAIALATPGAFVQLADGRTGTIMDLTDGVVFQVQAGGEMVPALRGELTVLEAAPPQPKVPTQPAKLSKQQQVLELRRCLRRILDSGYVPASLKAEAEKVLRLVA
jgi:hypothetical protein